MPRLFAILSFAPLFYVMDARPPETWVTTWAGAIQTFFNSGGIGSAVPAPEFENAWRNGVLDNQTIRIAIRSTLSGDRVRIRLSNEFGKKPLTVGMAHIVALPSFAMPGRGPAPSSFDRQPGRRNPVRAVRQIISPKGGQGQGYNPWDMEILGTDREILFSGNSSIVVAPGGIAISDPLYFETGDRGLMAVSLYLPKKTEPATWVRNAINPSVFQGNTASVFLGNTAKVAEGIPAPENRGWVSGSFWLSSVEVSGAAADKAILIIDDDGDRRDGVNPGAGWKEPFMDRLLSNGGSNRFAVLDSSLRSCAMLTTGSCRSSALERVQYAVRNDEGVKWVILAAGFEDILNASNPSVRPGQQPPKITSGDVIDALRNVVDAAHAAGLHICGVTYPSFPRIGYSGEADTMRQAVNRWIRGRGAFDAVADFDLRLADPGSPGKALSVFMGEGGSFGRLGFEAMANAFDLSVFER